ncbi:hypothetical protein OPQ81_005304 [Rhizoctonia solani]|nr:hypothetical protein OPQ81_005304 [Rhizoctonia solani]
MAYHPGLYLPSQVCFPPELPVSFKNVYDLKPIVGVPNDEEVIAIHTIIHAANRVSGIPGVHDPKFYMKLSDHLFNVQMVRYRSRYSPITFPSDATYTPPVLPSHVSINLESVSGAPSDDEIMKVQDAIQTYQELRRFPLLFDAHTNMELSQYLFDLQMARHMQSAGQTQPNLEPQSAVGPEYTSQTAQNTPKTTEEPIITTNKNVGGGANVVDTPQSLQPAPGVDVRELMERSNHLAERFNQLLERSNELMEHYSHMPADPSSSQALADRFTQVLERFTQVVEESHQPAVQSDRLTERFREPIAQSNRPTQKVNQPPERSTELADGTNLPAGKLNHHPECSKHLVEQFLKPVERLGDMLQNTNRVLASIQHAIVRNRKGNTVNAIDSLVNEKGELPGLMDTLNRSTIKQLSETFKYQPKHNCPVTIDGVSQYCCIPDIWLGDFIGFYGIGDGVCEDTTSNIVLPGKEQAARNKLSDYLTSCLG